MEPTPTNKNTTALLLVRAAGPWLLTTYYRPHASHKRRLSFPVSVLSYAYFQVKTMAEESEIPLLTEEPRHCPACGSRVAAKATTCLMCGALLVEEEVAPEEKPRWRWPSWIGSLVVGVLALVVLVIGGMGFYSMLTAEPELGDLPPTATPTRTPTTVPTATPTPTSTPTPAPTPIPPRVHQVQENETLIDIAIAYDLTVEEILVMNPDVDPDLIQANQILLIPAATPTVGPTSTLEPDAPTPTPANFTIHIVGPGDTLSSIAEEYDVSIENIRYANDLSPDEETIRLNQSLFIPKGTPTPSPTPTIDPNATPTPVPPYPAPPLLGPPDGTVFAGSDEPILLQWASVSVLGDDEWYELALSQPPGGVVSDTIYTHVTAWRVPFDLLLTASANAREFHWQVQVVREAGVVEGELVYEAAGAPSDARTFLWSESAPTPTSIP